MTIDLAEFIKQNGLSSSLTHCFKNVAIPAEHDNPFFPFIVDRTLVKNEFQFCSNEILECYGYSDNNGQAIFIVMENTVDVFHELIKVFGKPEIQTTLSINNGSNADTFFWSDKINIVVKKYSRIFGKPISENGMLIILSSVNTYELPKFKLKR